MGDIEAGVPETEKRWDQICLRIPFDIWFKKADITNYKVK